MEQQQQHHDHMWLPLPVEATSSNGIGNAITADPIPHKSHQHTPSTDRGCPSSPLSSPYTYTNADAPPHGTSHHHYQHSTPYLSSLSTQTRSQLPAGSPPPYAQAQTSTQAQHSQDPATLILPEPPSNELAPLQWKAQTDSNPSCLPSLASLTGASTSSSSSSHSQRVAPSPASFGDRLYSPPERSRPWPTGNPYSIYYKGSHVQSADSPARMDMDPVNYSTRTALSPESMLGRASSVSLDDPDVRMAAEALGDLKADFVSSPSNKTTPLPPKSPNHFGIPSPPEAEPLLSLVMTSGSLLAKPIEGTVSAYNTTKNFSPGFIKTPVDYIEGVVGSGLHLSGIEGGVRWFFRGKGRHQTSDLESGESSNSHKRRRVNSRGASTSALRRESSLATPSVDAHGPVDPYALADKDRRLSMSTIDTLPAYDDARSPAYTENAFIDEKEETDQTTPAGSRAPSTAPTAWQSRLIMSTSGLSIAMSEESLRSLKYCLSWLRWANEHIARVTDALKDSLEKYESHGKVPAPATMGDAEDVSTKREEEEARHAIGARIDALRKDVLKTLQGVIETVSKYAGGALPDNARALVRRHLTSLPQRFRLATKGSQANNDSQVASSSEESQETGIRDGAQRVLVLAKEGLDMMAQVSGVLDGTIVSAEEWCERLGRKKREEREQLYEHGEPQQQQQQAPTVLFTGVGVDGDVEMG